VSTALNLAVLKPIRAQSEKGASPLGEALFYFIVINALALIFLAILPLAGPLNSN
jgi:hypothetical protein